MSEDSDIGTADTMRERAGESRAKVWLLLDANRFAVTGVLGAAVFVAFMAAAVVLEPSLQSQLRNADTVETLFSAMIGTIVTGTTLVVTISQLVLSQETGPLGDQRKRMSDAMDFRTYAETLFTSAPPVQPSEFMRQLVEVSEIRATALERLVAENDDAELRRQVGEFVESVRGNADTVSDRLEDARFGSFDVMSAVLDFNYSWKIYQVDRMTYEFEESLDDDERAAFDALKTALAMYGPAREHIKTLYFQWALIDLSKYILYVAVPALVVASCMLTFVGAETFPGTTLGMDNVTWVVAGAFTVTVLPFLLFTAYILRIAVMAQRTLAIGALILRDSE